MASFNNDKNGVGKLLHASSGLSCLISAARRPKALREEILGLSSAEVLLLCYKVGGFVNTLRLSGRWGHQKRLLSSSLAALEAAAVVAAAVLQRPWDANLRNALVPFLWVLGETTLEECSAAGSLSGETPTEAACQEEAVVAVEGRASEDDKAPLGEARGKGRNDFLRRQHKLRISVFQCLQKALENADIKEALEPQLRPLMLGLMAEAASLLLTNALSPLHLVSLIEDRNVTAGELQQMGMLFLQALKARRHRKQMSSDSHNRRLTLVQPTACANWSIRLNAVCLWQLLCSPLPISIQLETKEVLEQILEDPSPTVRRAGVSFLLQLLRRCCVSSARQDVLLQPFALTGILELLLRAAADKGSPALRCLLVTEVVALLQQNQAQAHPFARALTAGLMPYRRADACAAAAAARSAAPAADAGRQLLSGRGAVASPMKRKRTPLTTPEASESLQPQLQDMLPPGALAVQTVQQLGASYPALLYVLAGCLGASVEASVGVSASVPSRHVVHNYIDRCKLAAGIFKGVEKELSLGSLPESSERTGTAELDSQPAEKPPSILVLSCLYTCGALISTRSAQDVELVEKEEPLRRFIKGAFPASLLLRGAGGPLSYSFWQLLLQLPASLFGLSGENPSESEGSDTTSSRDWIAPAAALEEERETPCAAEDAPYAAVLRRLLCILEEHLDGRRSCSPHSEAGVAAAAVAADAAFAAARATSEAVLSQQSAHSGGSMRRSKRLRDLSCASNDGLLEGSQSPPREPSEDAKSPSAEAGSPSEQSALFIEVLLPFLLRHQPLREKLLGALYRRLLGLIRGLRISLLGLQGGASCPRAPKGTQGRHCTRTRLDTFSRRNKGTGKVDGVRNAADRSAAAVGERFEVVLAGPLGTPPANSGSLASMAAALQVASLLRSIAGGREAMGLEGPPFRGPLPRALQLPAQELLMLTIGEYFRSLSGVLSRWRPFVRPAEALQKLLGAPSLGRAALAQLLPLPLWLILGSQREKLVVQARRMQFQLCMRALGAQRGLLRQSLSLFLGFAHLAAGYCCEDVSKPGIFCSWEPLRALVRVLGDTRFLKHGEKVPLPRSAGPPTTEDSATPLRTWLTSAQCVLEIYGVVFEHLAVLLSTEAPPVLAIARAGAGCECLVAWQTPDTALDRGSLVLDVVLLLPKLIKALFGWVSLMREGASASFKSTTVACDGPLGCGCSPLLSTEAVEHLHRLAWRSVEGALLGAFRFTQSCYLPGSTQVVQQQRQQDSKQRRKSSNRKSSVATLEERAGDPTDCLLQQGCLKSLGAALLHWEPCISEQTVSELLLRIHSICPQQQVLLQFLEACTAVATAERSAGRNSSLALAIRVPHRLEAVLRDILAVVATKSR
ncbi:60s ribosomal protein [Cyclospora cayetanensis]|uniref:60s ribosomal protein n=1 Tax=Cyclospora cayetanensis TaxID=88456 RepID=A0A1D3CWE0_9EIME|nr:60s ribosomal protein [Cyclospora cayetanensis]